MGHRFGRIVAVSLLALLVMGPLPVDAHDPPGNDGHLLSWLDCHWANRGRTTLRYTVSSAFPGQVTREGAVWSFEGRIQGVATEWNNRLAQVGSPLRLQQRPVVDAAEIRFVYNATLPVGALGGTTISTHINSCAISDLHDPPPGEQITGTVLIEFPSRNDWFTAWDLTRAFWENDCPTYPDRNPAPPDAPFDFTCSRLYDFGGTAAHEIGHALGIGHPNYIDNAFHADDNQPAQRLANCRNVEPNSLADATMCGYGAIAINRYRSSRRTLDNYDLNSLDAKLEVFGG